MNRGNNLRDILFKKEIVKFSFDGILKAGKYDRVILRNDLIIKNGFANTYFILNGEFKWTQEKINKEIELGITFIVKSQKLSVRFIRKELKTKRPSDIISKDECGVDTNETAKKELQLLVPNNSMDYPKPKSLIKYLLKFNEDKRTNKIILDFFAGSGTTGHAVLELNKEDGRDRKFILCTNNENNICEEVTYQRLKNIQDQLPHNLKYFKTELISKYVDDEIIFEKILKHIKELIELEHHIEIDNEKYIILDDEDKLETVLKKIKKDGILFIYDGVFLSRTDQRILDDKNIRIVDIPEYYYRSELKELGDL